MDAKARQRIDDFNELLEQLSFPFRVDLVNPIDLKPAPKNAHFMKSETYNQLVDNIRHDQGLSSVPFCWRDKKGTTHILSGHHRVQAAIEAGNEWIIILYTNRALSREEQIAIQLSHNSIFGEDDPTLLRELWNEIKNLDLKIYSGLDDRILDSYQPISIDSLGEKDVTFQEITLAFFPSELERVEEVFKEISKRRRTRYAAQLEQFDRFLERLMDFKEAAQIYNAATAILAILDMMEEWLDSQANQGDDIGESNGSA